MSDRYIQRLRSVRQEFDIAQEALRYVLGNWHNQVIIAAFSPRTLTQFVRTEQNLEITYFVRLTAEFEGILKDHLLTNHSTVVFPARRADWKVDWFLNRVTQREKIQIDANLRQNLDSIRDYRNSLAHGNPAQVIVSFNEALAWYNTFLAKLPEPL